jgi:uncharacterized protein YdbL (DUF1318 family)
MISEVCDSIFLAVLSVQINLKHQNSSVFAMQLDAARTVGTQTEVLRGFFQSLQEDAKIVPQSGQTAYCQSLSIYHPPVILL